MPRALLGEVSSGLREPNRTPPTPFDSVQHVIDGWSLRKAPELACQILLKRLATSLGAALKRRVHIIGNIAN